MSYFEERIEIVTVVCGADLSATAALPGANRFVTLNSDSEAVLSAANALAYGVMTTNQPQDAAGRVAIGGIVPVLVGAGGVVAGTPAGAGADGTLVTGATTKLGVPVLTGAAGDIVPFRLNLTANAAV